MKRIGVDVGGTFTDFILVDEETRRITVDKLRSTPKDPARAVVEGVRGVCEKAGVALSEVDNLLHGTTVATNIVLTNSGAEVGMLTTQGFRDVIHIARHKRPYNFSLQLELPWQSRPLVKRRHRLTVKERVTVPHGEVVTALDEDEVRVRVRALREAGVEAIAVCLLHSYLNPGHERRIKEIVLEEFPDCYLSVSSEVLPLYLHGGAERVHRAAGVALCGRLRRGDAVRWVPSRHPADAVLGRHGDGGGSHHQAGQPADVRAGGGLDRRHLGGAARGFRQRRHPRHRWHLG
jgi:N-methylhydantoinase A/oxoprolinase/acetone carboxylase beta subunit